VHRITRRVLIALAVIFGAVAIWSRVRIVFWVRVSLWQLALLFVVLAAAIYLLFELLLGARDGR